MATADGGSKSHVNIIDIRREELDESLLKLLLKSLNPDDKGQRALPTLLLYDGRSGVYNSPRFQLMWEQRLG